MLTKKRKELLSGLRYKWEQVERAKEEYPTYGPILVPSTREEHPELFGRAASEIGVAPEELQEFLEWVFGEEHTIDVQDTLMAANHEMTEEELRDIQDFAQGES